MSNKLTRKGLILCLVGAAGSGKTTLCRKLLEEQGARVTKSVSVTSRSPRPGEVNGKSYFFVSRDEFMRKVASGELFEWEEVHGNLYGQLKSTITNAISSGIDLILDIDIKGAFSVKKAYCDFTSIVFLLPPSFEELKNRMLSRGPMEASEFERRIQTANREYETLLASFTDKGKIDYLLVNDKIQDTMNCLNGILSAERSRLSRYEASEVRDVCYGGFK